MHISELLKVIFPADAKPLLFLAVFPNSGETTNNFSAKWSFLYNLLYDHVIAWQIGSVAKGCHYQRTTRDNIKVVDSL